MQTQQTQASRQNPKTKLNLNQTHTGKRATMARNASAAPASAELNLNSTHILN